MFSQIQDESESGHIMINLYNIGDMEWLNLKCCKKKKKKKVGEILLLYDMLQHTIVYLTRNKCKFT